MPRWRRRARSRRRENGGDARRPSGPRGGRRDPTYSARGTRTGGATRSSARRRRRRGRRRDLSGFELLDERHDVAVIAQVLDEEDLLPRDDHRLRRSLRLAPTPDELGAGLVGGRQVEDIAQEEPVVALRLEHAEVGRPVRQEDGLVGAVVDRLCCAWREEG